MTNQTEVSNRTHRRAVRFFWGFLIGATTISLAGNITHAVLSYIPRVVVQIGAATVPPIALLAAVHGIALAVGAGASGRGLLLGGHCGRSHRHRRVHREFPGAARSDASHRVQHRNGMDVPRDHRHCGGREHADAGCARRQTCAAHPHRDDVRRYTNTGGPNAAPLFRCEAQSPRSHRLHRPVGGRRRHTSSGCRPLHRYNPIRHGQCRFQRKASWHKSIQTLHQS
jgi:hypothetical protein